MNDPVVSFGKMSTSINNKKQQQTNFTKQLFKLRELNMVNHGRIAVSSVDSHFSIFSVHKSSFAFFFRFKRSVSRDLFVVCGLISWKHHSTVSHRSSEKTSSQELFEEISVIALLRK